MGLEGSRWAWGASGTKVGFPIDFQVDPRNPNRIFANAYGGGNFLSEDGGRTWAIASHGYTGAQLHAITVAPGDPRRVYTIGRSGPFRSLNGGDVWEGLSYGAADMSSEWYDVAIDPANTSVVLISGEHQGNMLRSTDGGLTWRLAFMHPAANATDPTAQHGFKAIAFAPSDHNIVYAGMSHDRNRIDQGTAGPSFGMYKSTDNGVTWRESNDAQSAGQNISALAVHPRDPNTVYAATLKGGVLKSTNGGQTWQAINQGLQLPDIRSIAIDWQNPQVLYAGAENGGMYKSANGGAIWQLSSNGMDPQAAVRTIAIDPNNAQVVYAADVHTGVYRSDNGGALWVRVNNGLRTRSVKDLAFSSDGSMLYAATEGEGVFRLETAR